MTYTDASQDAVIEFTELKAIDEGPAAVPRCLFHQVQTSL